MEHDGRIMTERSGLSSTHELPPSSGTWTIVGDFRDVGGCFFSREAKKILERTYGSEHVDAIQVPRGKHHKEERYVSIVGDRDFHTIPAIQDPQGVFVEGYSGLLHRMG